MADKLSIAKKAKKVTLPSGWVERFSKKHPDRPFYFNENTGESRWSAPLDEVNKSQKSQKGRKRKADIDSEDYPDDETNTNAAKLLHAITKDRPILKAKGPKAAAAEVKEVKNDTPAMRLYREKMAERKAALEAKKKGTKTPNQKQNQTAGLSKVVSLSSPPSTPLNKRRTRASSIASTESDVSKCSTIINGSDSDSSIGSKIKAAAVPLVRIPSTSHKPTAQTPAKKLPKITKVQQIKSSSPKRSVNVAINNYEDLSESSIANESTNEEDVATIGSARKSFNSRCSANERLAKLRKRLSSENNNPSPNKSARQSNVNNNNNIPSSPSEKKNYAGSSGLLEINRSKRINADEEEYLQNKSLLDKIEDSDVYCEQMEWEPIEHERLLSEVYSVRNQVCGKRAEKLGELSCNALQSMDTPTDQQNALYIVIDTNVFLSNLEFVEEVRDSRSEAFGRPFLVIPWTVLQELDFIKDDKNHTRSNALKLKARRAVEFLNKHFTTKHPRFLGQSPIDVEKNKEKFMLECPDDEILQTCLQIKEMSKSPVLLSYDKNLCNKAMIHDIPTLGRDDPLEKAYYLKAAETSDFLSHSLHTRIEENAADASIIQKELLAADDIFEEGKAVLKAVLSEVVAMQMEGLFGNRWEMHCIVRPPWSILTVLKCALKHWMAVVSDSFTRRTESMLRDLQTCIHRAPESGRKLKDVKFFLDKCGEVFQTLDVSKHKDLKMQSLNKIEELSQRCSKAVEELDKERLLDSVGSVEDAAEIERRAEFAFKIFEEVYAFARDSCGIASEALGLQCSFSYNKQHPYITPRYALHEKQNIGVDVNKLLQVLTMTLSIVDEGIQPNHKAILTLYEVLNNFACDPKYDEISKLTPLDLLCCIRLLKQKLEKGCEQLQELAAHFCRMANYQCFKKSTYT
ncbi:transcriptional protein SWT1 isoform X2 [Nasonia vitripennis]|uniref:WW domain-containing protein n=1 Tax=Nasonia vitripennis TaxID=7425 RepID=A0A7M7QBJ0_NASVI|nr:transcriptional protein SWT1 isoform X2 [Nasonia vitripennis]